MTADVVDRPQPGKGRLTQLDHVYNFRPDIITVTIGGNDIGFGGTVTRCILEDLLVVLTCPINADEVVLKDAQPGEKASFDGLYHRLVKTYIAIREAQGDGHLFVLSYPTIFERGRAWPLQYHLPPVQCFSFNAAQAREANKLGTRLGDTIYLAVQAANEEVGNVHFVDWRETIVTESEGAFFNRTRVRLAYNNDGLCAREPTWDINGYANMPGQALTKDSFHPTEQGYRTVGSRLYSEIAKAVSRFRRRA